MKGEKVQFQQAQQFVTFAEFGKMNNLKVKILSEVLKVFNSTMGDENEINSHKCELGGALTMIDSWHHDDSGKQAGAELDQAQP